MAGHLTNDKPNDNSFPTTQWTLIVRAIQEGDAINAEAALAHFCDKYRPAIVSFFGRRGCTPDQAEEYTQEFFLKKIHKPWGNRTGLLFSANREKTKRFRFFLAQILRFFMIEQWRRDESRLGQELLTDDLPESGAGLDTQFEKFQQEIDRPLAVQIVYDAIKMAQPSPYHIKFWNSDISQKEAADALGQSEDAFTKSYSRFRRRLRDELRRAVAEMIENPEDIDSEIRYFLSIFVRSTASLSDTDSRSSK
jgi:DNA-directed RNA polymerase specialized sigma24 family protein